jgi:dCTP deaminase
MRLSYQTIKQMSIQDNLIKPFIEKHIDQETNLSGGASSAGYDVHLGGIKTPRYKGEMIGKREIQSVWYDLKPERDKRKQTLKDLEATYHENRQLSIDKVSTEKAKAKAIRAEVKTLASEIDQIRIDIETETDETSLEHLKDILQQKKTEKTLKNNEIEAIKTYMDDEYVVFKKLKTTWGSDGEIARNRIEEVSKPIFTKQYVLKAGDIALGVTKERFEIPSNICADYYNKSTVLRRFLTIAASLIEPNWKGYLTLEIKNDSHVDVTLRVGQPIGQITFTKMDKFTDQPYEGKYQDQGPEPKDAI